MCSVCFNVDIIKGPLQIDEAHASISKVKAVENLHYPNGHILPERMEHLVENGQWSWTHPSEPTTIVRDLPPCSYCTLAKVKRLSLRGPIIISDQIGGLLFADVQGPFEVPSLKGSVYKIDISSRRKHITYG